MLTEFELEEMARESEDRAMEIAQLKANKQSVIDVLTEVGATDFEGLPPSELNYLQCIRNMKIHASKWAHEAERAKQERNAAEREHARLSEACADYLDAINCNKSGDIPTILLQLGENR